MVDAFQLPYFGRPGYWPSSLHHRHFLRATAHESETAAVVGQREGSGDFGYARVRSAEGCGRRKDVWAAYLVIRISGPVRFECISCHFYFIVSLFRR